MLQVLGWEPVLTQPLSNTPNRLYSQRKAATGCVCLSQLVYADFLCEHSEEERKVGLLIQTPSGGQDTALLHCEGTSVTSAEKSATNYGTAQDPG